MGVCAINGTFINNIRMELIGSIIAIMLFLIVFILGWIGGVITAVWIFKKVPTKITGREIIVDGRTGDTYTKTKEKTLD